MESFFQKITHIHKNNFLCPTCQKASFPLTKLTMTSTPKYMIIWLKKSSFIKKLVNFKEAKVENQLYEFKSSTIHYVKFFFRF